MPQVHIALQDGFSGDSVIVQVNDQAVFRESGVRTRMQIGLAATFDVDVQPGTAQVDIDLPQRGINAHIEVSVPGTPYIGISVGRDGRIEDVLQPEPFHYA